MKKAILLALALGLAGFVQPASAEAQLFPTATDCQQDSALQGEEPQALCPNQIDTTTLCLNDVMCDLTNGEWEYPENGSCTNGTQTTLGSVPQACRAAASVTDPADCTTGCESEAIQTERTKTATCCTVKKTRLCQAP